MNKEIIEIKTKFKTQDHVRRIADHGRRSSDISHNHLGNYYWSCIYFQDFTYLVGQGGKKKHHCDTVHKGREQRCYNWEKDKYLPWRILQPSGKYEGQECKKTCI